MASIDMPASTSDAQTSTQTQDDETSLDISLLKEISKKNLIEALNSVSTTLFSVRPLTPLQVNGAKTLVLDPSLAGPLGLITEVALLKVCMVTQTFSGTDFEVIHSTMESTRCSGSNLAPCPQQRLISFICVGH